MLCPHLSRALSCKRSAPRPWTAGSMLSETLIPGAFFACLLARASCVLFTCSHFSRFFRLSLCFAVCSSGVVSCVPRSCLAGLRGARADPARKAPRNASSVGEHTAFVADTISAGQRTGAVRHLGLFALLAVAGTLPLLMSPLTVASGAKLRLWCVPCAHPMLLFLPSLCFMPCDLWAL